MATIPDESSSQRGKRQAATPAKETAPVSDPVNSTEADTTEQAIAPTDVVTEENNVAESTTKASPSPARKRGAPKSTPTSVKKTKGQTAEVDNGSAAVDEGEPVQTTTTTTPKKARTSAPKKTPEPPSEEYARKLRPRK